MRDAPLAEYRRRLELRSEAVARQQRRSLLLSRLRLGVFLAGVGVGWLVVERHWSALALLAPGLLFAALVLLHDRVCSATARIRRAVAFYEDGIDRLTDRWRGRGESGERYRDPTHPYAEHLDLFGRSSLFEHVCAARTPVGQSTLAAWLKEAAPETEIRARQQAIEELRPRLDLREEMALLGRERLGHLDAETLIAWAQAPDRCHTASLRLLAAAVAAAAVTSLVGWLALGWGAYPLLAAFALIWAVSSWFRPRLGPLLAVLDATGGQLDLLSLVLQRVERGGFQSTRLQSLARSLHGDDRPASRHIARLRRLGEWHDSARNLFFAPVAAVLLWRVQVGLAIAAWRARNGPAIEGWLRVAGEFEALLSFSRLAYEHPDDPFPQIVDSPACFVGEGLGHPLLAEDQCVRNDLRLDEELRLYVISGSNMSGKSTLLRTVGLNTVLALAGATVRARGLRLGHLAVGASIRVVDSLAEGVSHFYAEVQQLQRMMDLVAGQATALILLDEIFHGTNSHDRRIGAEAVLRRLLDGGAMVLVTTHDLALAAVADALAPAGVNVHFEDHLEDGKMVFDYRMRSGVITRGNALELMRAVGLLGEVPAAPQDEAN